jgi:hypothetical protein
VRLENNRRADILALRPDGGFVCIEVKSGLADFQADRKWHHYRDYADALYFAVDADFPQEILPEDCGLIVVWETADLLRAAPEHRMAPARRRILTQRFAHLAALRLQAAQDPSGMIEMQMALRSD